MSLLFPLFEPSNTLARDSLIVFAIGITFKLLFFVIFFARTANATLLPPSTGRNEFSGGQEPGGARAVDMEGLTP